MGLKKVLKFGFLDGVNPKKIMGPESVKMQTKIMSDSFKSAFKRNKKEKYTPTSFEDCMQHYNISEADLKKRIKNANYTVSFCMGLSLLTLVSLVYQCMQHSISGAVLSLTLALLLWAMAFREHYNLFQMRERKLGCTVKEWFNSLFKKNKV